MNFSGKQRRTSFDEMGGSDDFMNDDGFMDDQADSIIGFIIIELRKDSLVFIL